jgi:hypothetical protein
MAAAVLPRTAAQPDLGLMLGACASLSGDGTAGAGMVDALPGPSDPRQTPRAR